MRKEEKARLRSELKNRLRQGKTLVYFASGGWVREEYYSLPYDNVILVDYTFRDRQCTVRRCGGNVICIGLDALEAVWLFRTTGVKIDAFVAINEGLSEGGGRYVINSDIFLGYALPVLADPFIHIGMVGYYGGPEHYHIRAHWLDIPYTQKRVLPPDDPAYIPPAVFTRDKRYARKAEVTLLSGRSQREHTILRGEKEIVLKHDSIWSDLKELDALFVRYENIDQEKAILNVEAGRHSPKILRIKVDHNGSDDRGAFSLDEILALSSERRWTNIGLVPNQGDYERFVREFAAREGEWPRRVTFYHMNREDLAELYQMQ